jgi:transposase
VWAKRHRDLTRARNQAACRLHAVLCDLVPGVAKEITAAHAAHILESATPPRVVQVARQELAAEFLNGIRRLDTHDAESREGREPEAGPGS